MSNNIRMNRRQVSGSLLAFATPLSETLALPRVTAECLLQNEFVEFRLRTRACEHGLRKSPPPPRQYRTLPRSR